MTGQPLTSGDEPLLVRGGRVLGPTPGETSVRDLAIAEGKLVPPAELGGDTRVLDAEGLVVAPGLIDLHVHLREPGGEHKETVESGAMSGLHGGWTTLCAMPNTQPPVDTIERMQQVHASAERAGLARVLQYAAVTRGQQGSELVDYRALTGAGCVAFSDDGVPISNPKVMRDALLGLREVDRPIMIHAEEMAFVEGPIHAGETARRLGVGGIDPLAEELMTLRDVFLSEVTGARIHICHVSTARSVEIIRRARAHGVLVTSEVCPHHLLLTDAAVGDGDTDFKMNPPLRTEADCAAVLAGLVDGTIDAIATDHAPHHADEKARGLAEAPFGIVGLETALPLVLTHIVGPGHLTLEDAVRRMSGAPADILRLPHGRIADGAPGDLVLIDPLAEWSLDRGQLRSLSRNTPFDGWTVKGRPIATIVGGRAFDLTGGRVGLKAP